MDTNQICIGPHSATETTATSKLAEKYRLMASKDVSSEEARAAKRAKRSANAILGESAGSRATSVDVPGSGSATPTSVIGDKALGGPDKKGLSKKEAKKQMDARASEAQQHQQSIETARMATNNMLSGRMFGNTKKTYSWLNRGTSTNTSFASPRLNAPSSLGGDKGGKLGDANAAAATKRLGEWREDKEKGAGIQMRDLLFALEQDGRGLRHVQKAYSKDLKEDRVN